MNDTVTERVWHIAEPVVADEGLEMVDVEFRRESHGMILRLYLDRPGGVSLDELSRLNRRIGDLLDVHDIVPGSYTLEVSSPGINRRLRRPEHFQRYLGQRVRVRTVLPLEGRRTFVGSLRAVDPDSISIEQDGVPYVIPLREIGQANYEPEWERPRR